MYLQEIVLESCVTQDWNKVAQGFPKGFHAMTIVGLSRGLVVSWNEAMFSKDDSWRGPFVVATKLKRHNDLECVVVPMYNFVNVVMTVLYGS